MEFAAYLFLDHARSWESYITTNPRELEGCESWYCAGGVNTISDVFDLLEAHGFEPDYFYEFVDRMPHRLFNLLNKDGAF